MLVLIEGGEVLAPEPIGPAAVLLAGDRILKVGAVDGRALAALGVDVEVVARGRRMVKAGRLSVTERFLEQSNRKVELHGRKHKGR